MAIKSKLIVLVILEKSLNWIIKKKKSGVVIHLQFMTAFDNY